MKVSVKCLLAGMVLLAATSGFAQMLESFEEVPIGYMPPVGWRKWEEAGGRGWSNSFAGRMPMPGWMSGTNTVPPDPAGGSRLAYVTYTHGGAKTNDLWLISPTLKGVVATSTVSFWYRSSFSNFADNIYVHISTNPAAYRKSDFTIEAYHAYFPRGYPGPAGVNKRDYPEWTNIIVNIGSLVPAGTDIRLGFREYHQNNWYDVRANEMDVIRTDLWAPPVVSTITARVISPTTIAVDYYAFAGYPAGSCGIAWGPGPTPEIAHNSIYVSQGSGTGIISNFPNNQACSVRAFVKHSRGTYYGNDIAIQAGDSNGEGFLLESFEDVPIGQMPPAGWRKWEEAGGRGWSNSYAGRIPMPGWMSGTNTTPPDPDGGSRLAYVTYTHGGAKTNDLWLISPTIRNVPSNCPLSFWYRSSFSNFADNIYVMISTNPAASRKSDFTIEADHLYFPRGYPGPAGVNKRDFPEWTNVMVDIGALVPAGTDIRLGFREYHNNNWYDVRANEMDAIKMGSRVRNALKFDGIDDYVGFPITNGPAIYTIEAWVKPESVINQNILLSDDPNPLIDYYQQLRISGGVFEHSLNDGAIKTVGGTTVLQTGRWYHVAGTARNGGLMRLFVNGVEEGVPSAVGTMFNGPLWFRAGAASGGGFGAFNGLIDEVRFWNTERTTNQILDAMNIYLRGIESGLQACYRFDCSWGTNVFDSSEPPYDVYLAGGATDPQWVGAETPQGDYLAAENWNNRGLWTEKSDTAPTNGLAVSAPVSGITNFMVFGHNNLRDATATDLPAGFAGSRLSRVWYADVHGNTNPVADLSFTPSQAGSSNWYIPGGDYALLGRSSKSGAFSIQKSAADSVTGGNVNFTNVALNEGYYTIGLAVPSAPNAVNATGITARAFWANWDASANATNYWLDVASNAAFTVYVPGFQNLMMGNKLTAAVTGLLPGITYHCRLRAEHAGGISTNSATVSVTTLTEGAIGVSSSVVNFATQYGADPAPQLISITNSGQTLYLFTNTVGYSSEASAWLSVVPIDGAMGALTSALQALTVSAAGINAGVYSATNYINSPTATNSPQSWVAILTVNKADQSISFPAIAAQETTNTIGLLASSSSGLPVTFAVVSGLASISGGTNLSFSGAGSVSIAASQSGNTNWNAAANVTNTFNVTKATASVTLNNLTQNYDGTPRAVTATTVPAGLTVDITYDGSSSAPTNSGSYAIAAVVNEVMYQGSESGTLIVNKADQTITFPPIADQPIQNTVGLSATATSGFDVSFSLNPGPAILSAGTNLSFSATGMVSIVASQAGNTNWNAAPDFTNTFNVYDDVVPAILGCPSDISLTNDSGICTTIATWTSPTATDNWAVAWFTNNYDSGDTFSAGVSTVIYVAMDQAGNSSTCSFDVIVYDVEVPSISGCPADILTTNNPGNCSAVVTWVAPTADDNCAVDSFTNNFSSGDSFNVGTTTVEYVAADVAGNSATCSFNVVVSDVEDPFISGCPADIAITNDPGNCSAAVTWTAPTADDNCGVASFTSTDDPGDVFNVGTSVVEYVASDAAGHSVTCSFTIVVSDTEAPVISGCPTDILITNDPGNCSAVVTWAAPTADDNCAVDSFTNNFNSGDTFNAGTTVVHYVAADLAGNATTCSFNVVVADTEQPVISGCPADILTTNIPGACSAVVIWTAPTADDNCAVVSFTSTDDSGDVFNAGTSVVEYVAADAAGHSVTCSFTIVVSDTEAPVISGCPVDILTTNDPGDCSAAVTWAAPTADDNCGVDSFTNNLNSGDTFNTGTTLVYYVAADVAGNSATCSFNVVVADTEQPVISGCPADILTTNIPGACAAVVTWVAPTADDNCGVDSFTNNYSSGDTFNVGTTVVHYVAADVAGNSTTCSFDVVVADVEDPSISGCPADIAVTNDPGNCSAVVTWAAPTADDNCAVVSFTSTDDSGDVFNVGTSVVEYVAADAAGHSVTCSFIIVVSDSEAPVISGCPADILTTNDPGNCSAVVTWTVPTADDNCAVVSFTNDYNSGDTFNTGTTVVHYVASDTAGNSSTCTFNVVVADVEQPVISGCPADIATTNIPGACAAVVTWIAPTADDNCGLDSFTNNYNSGDSFNVGTTFVHYVAADLAGNAATCSFSIVVSDVEDPSIGGCPADIAITNDSGNCGAAVTWTAPTADDNCAVVSFTSTDDPGDVFNAGTSVVEYVAADAAGHSVTCSFTIVVSDTEAPVISGCPADILTTNDPGDCSAVVTWIAPTADENCAVDSFTNNYNSGSTFNVGTTLVVYVAADVAGNSTTCTFNVIVVDAEQPVISGCPAEIAITNAPGNCSALVTWIAPTADDNCEVDSFTNNYNSGSTFNVGTTLVAYVAADAAGNTATCSFNVVVADVDDPSISGCPTDILTTNDPGNCSALVTWPAPTADDNCAVDSFISNYEPGDVFNVGTSVVEYVAADTSGHSVTCSFTIAVSDTEAPVISGCPADILTTNDPGNCSAVVTWAVPTADDNCGVDSFTNNYSSGDTFNVGTTLVVFVAADVAGNSVTCFFEVVVTDSESPRIICPADIHVAVGYGTNSAVILYTEPSGSDICSGAETVQTAGLPPGSAFPTGVTVNTFMVTDAAGNTAECSFTVTVDQSYPLVISGWPEPHGLPGPQGYGTSLMPANQQITNRVVTPADETGGVHYVCSGWSGTGAVPSSGDISEVVFMFLEPSTLTWLWDKEYLLTWAAENGSVAGMTSGWKSPGMIYDLVPYASAGYVFTGWQINGSAAGASPMLSVTSDAPYSIEALFAAAAWDLNVTGTAERIAVRYDPARTAYFATFGVCNTNGSGWLMTDRFVYGLDASVSMQVRGKDGVNPFGEDYLDVTADVLGKLPLIGNGDLVLDPGECVVLDEIELTGKKLVDSPSRLYAKGARDLSGRDTDGDGLPNNWEDETGLDYNDPADARRDQDGDGMIALDEFWANTDPLNPQSLLRIQNIGFASGTHSVIWIGGTSVLQYLEWAETLPGTWMTLATNPPPTLITNLFSGEVPVTQGFYRVRTRQAE